MNDTRKAVQVRITGLVQGVWYRAWTQSEARKLGLTGWVRNEPDGSVAALFTGDAGRIETMVSKLWRGPASARVDNVEVVAARIDRIPQGFDVIG